MTLIVNCGDCDWAVAIVFLSWGQIPIMSELSVGIHLKASEVVSKIVKTGKTRD